MSHDHVNAAVLLEGIPPAPKSVLIHLAQPACKYCGLVWAGIGWIERKSGLGRTAITSALEYLVKDGHLTVHAYPRGGRGRATEYVVLPMVVVLSTPRCGECREKMERGRHAAGIDNPGTEKPTATRPVLEKPTAGGPQNQPLGGYQSVIESESVTEPADPPASPPGPAEPARPDPNPPQNATEALARVSDMVRGITATTSEVPHTAKPCPPGDGIQRR